MENYNLRDLLLEKERLNNDITISEDTYYMLVERIDNIIINNFSNKEIRDMEKELYKEENMKDKLKEIFERLEEINEDYRNEFEVAIYLYFRYGATPTEETIQKIKKIIDNNDTLFNDNINEEVDNIWEEIE